MTRILVLAFMLLGTAISAQIQYEDGYIVGNDGQRTTCLIRNVDWYKNPTHIEYKLQDNSKTERAKIETIAEFGVGNEVKFVRYTVDIDRSSNDLHKLTSSRNAQFSNETLLLKVLIEGEASLLHYYDGETERFFYSIGDSPVEQLVYRKYMASHDQVGYNRDYREQIWRDLQCGAFARSDLEKMRYSQKDLKKTCKRYNTCVNSASVEYKARQNTGALHITPQLGFRTAWTYIETNWNNVDFGTKVGATVGLELEYILPFNRQKWGLWASGTYQSFEGDGTLYIHDGHLEYRSIELPIGLRYYVFLGEKTKLYFDAAVLLDIVTHGEITFEREQTMELRTLTSFAAGAGIKLFDRVSCALRYNFPRTISRYHLYPDSGYSSLSIVVGYSII